MCFFFDIELWKITFYYKIVAKIKQRFVRTLPNSNTNMILNIQTDKHINRHLSPTSPSRKKIIFEILLIVPNLMVKIPDYQKNPEDWEACKKLWLAGKKPAFKKKLLLFGHVYWLIMKYSGAQNSVIGDEKS